MKILRTRWLAVLALLTRSFPPVRAADMRELVPARAGV